MNHREPPHLSAGMRRALRCLSLLLLPALTLDEGHAGTRVRMPGRDRSPAPYLPILGSPSLQFQEAAPPPDLVTRPASGAPPVPALSVAESSVAVANSDAARSAAVAATDSVPAEAAAATAPTPPTPPTKTPPAILPDDTRPVIHPEDFLPYFQIPGAAKQPADVRVIVPGAPAAPTPAPIPPSSATYTQTPQ